MALPASFKASGFGPIPPRKFKRLMIGSEGPANSGKTEFILSCPGPGIVICLDRQIDSTLDNPNPPASRRNDYAFCLIQAPKETGATKETFQAHWTDFYGKLKAGTENPDARTLAIDGDSDSWELQRLAEFGKLAGVGKSLTYAGVNAARRQMYTRLYDSGKIIVCTNKVSREYKVVTKPDGSPDLDEKGNVKREWDGKSYERQGFSDYEYLFQVQIRHMQNKENGTWGLLILRAKANPGVEGIELWGDDCHFTGLVQTIYPQIDLKEWGL